MVSSYMWLKVMGFHFARFLVFMLHVYVYLYNSIPQFMCAATKKLQTKQTTILRQE